MAFHTWPFVLPALFLLSVMPGPINLLAAANGLRFGVGAAACAVAGRIAAFAVMITLTIAGLGALIAASETAFATVKWCGVAYLAWLGIQTWRAPPLLATGPAVEGPAGLSGLARQELWLAISNPKAILIFTAAFPQLVDSTLPATPQLAVSGARLFASHGVVALALGWLGGDVQSPGNCEVPLETFTAAVDELVARGCKRLALIGTSKGAEAALMTAVHDPRLDVVVAISPTSVVWGNVGPGRDGEVWPQRSSWTYQGAPLPFVASDPYWKREYVDSLISYRSLYEQSLLRFASEVEAATIPVETATAQIVLVAGGSDALWPSDTFAKSVATRLAAFESVRDCC